MDAAIMTEKKVKTDKEKLKELREEVKKLKSRLKEARSNEEHQYKMKWKAVGELSAISKEFPKKYYKITYLALSNQKSEHTYTEIIEGYTLNQCILKIKDKLTHAHSFKLVDSVCFGA